MYPMYHVLHLNPEPWAVGSISGKRMSPNLNLVAFQESVREALQEAPKAARGEIKLTFYLWRQQATYLDTRDRIRSRNQADATNMQKGLEDALQGVLFDNDRDVRDIHTVIIDQGPHVKPCIVIVVEQYDEVNVHDLPSDILSKIVSRPVETAKNDWSDDEIF